MQIMQPGDSSTLIEKLLDERATELGDHLGADFLAFFGPILQGVDDIVKDAVEKMASERKPKLVVVVETEGGYIEVVERIVRVLRHHYPNQVDFVVPNYAMSAGTVLVMSGDSIYMDYYSVLGPIDPQIPNAEGRMIPASGYLRKYEKLLEKADKGLLNTAETTILLEKFDQGELYSYERARELSVSLLLDWLCKYKFKNWNKTRTAGIKVTPEMRSARAKEIGEMLNDTEVWHSHGRGIPMSVLTEKVKVEIDDFGKDRELSRKINEYHRLAVDFQKKHSLGGMAHVSGTIIPTFMRA